MHITFVTEGLTFTGDNTAMATLLLSVMGAFAEFERSLIRERQREGNALARARESRRSPGRGLSTFRPRRLAEPDLIAFLTQRYAAKLSTSSPTPTRYAPTVSRHKL